MTKTKGIIVYLILAIIQPLMCGLNAMVLTGSNTEETVGQQGDTIFSSRVEAEEGSLGSDFIVLSHSGAEAITIATDMINTLNPGSAARIASYVVSFPEQGEYDLYARIYVGEGAFNDDSHFIPAGFGIQNPEADSSWYRVNGLANGGYTEAEAIVENLGNAGSNSWKWVNLTRLAEGANSQPYIVGPDSLTLVFQIGAREDGLYFDKFVFGKSNLLYTVDALMNEGPGLTEYPRSGTPLAQGQEKFLGSGYDDIQAPLFDGYWNQLTPGNAGKWGSVEWTRDQMNWTALDEAYHYADRYNMVFKEHTLLWGAQQPGWMADLDSAEQRQEIEEWFAALAERYGDFDLIDVVNEPIHNAPNGMVPWGTTEPNINYAVALGGAGVTGWDWIIEAFRLARQYFPGSKLILNEYSVINSTETTETMIEIVELLKAEGLIDGIGEQAHAFTTNGVSIYTLKKNLDALAATGIPVYISEFDIDGPTDLLQLQEIRRVFSLFWEHPAVAGITLWGYRYGLWRNDQGAYLITEDGTERLAMTWLKAYVNDSLQDVENINITTEEGISTIDEIGGTLHLKAEVLPENATIRNYTWTVQQSNLASIDQSGVLTAKADGIVTVKALPWDGSGSNGSIDIEINTEVISGLDNSPGDIRIYPNPSTDGVFRVSGIAGITRVRVLDISGRVIKEYSSPGKSTLKIELGRECGWYLLEFTGDHSRHMEKVIIGR